MRIPRTIGERAPAQVQTTLYLVHSADAKKKEAKKGIPTEWGRDVGRTQGNNRTHDRSTHGRQQWRTRQLGLAHMYQYGDTKKVYGDMPLPIDEHDTLTHVGGNANRIKPYANEKGIISMNSNFGDLRQDQSV
jgi:hypothetical protein